MEGLPKIGPIASFDEQDGARTLNWRHHESYLHVVREEGVLSVRLPAVIPPLEVVNGQWSEGLTMLIKFRHRIDVINSIKVSLSRST